ncbi:MAG: hypothetical protein JHC23_06385 [Sulfolobus sp.]|nr:hypothetical protein [Sulfolobus sp.]
MNELTISMKVVKALAEHVPEDCREILLKVAEKFARDAMALGLDKALAKWYGIEDDIDVLIEMESP